MESDAPIPVESDERMLHLGIVVSECAIGLFDKGYTTQEIAAAFSHQLFEFQKIILKAKDDEDFDVRV